MMTLIIVFQCVNYPFQKWLKDFQLFIADDSPSFLFLVTCWSQPVSLHTATYCCGICMEFSTFLPSDGKFRFTPGVRHALLKKSFDKQMEFFFRMRSYLCDICLDRNKVPEKELKTNKQHRVGGRKGVLKCTITEFHTCSSSSDYSQLTLQLWLRCSIVINYE